ncbi:neuroglian-like [Diorhabda carinulata]|uniref:neuroglian-like n=1 Tax=Diorhabda carinulata TaxID=1163345 RepID=UPI0025A13E4F|nr:neuroglian-like [Diorhabda carinulata]
MKLFSAFLDFFTDSPNMWRTSVVLCIFLIVLIGCLADRELIPLDPPGNLTLLEFEDRDVIVEWDPVEAESVRGTFKGYLVRIWNHVWSQVYAIPPGTTKTAVQFYPFSRNFITVAVRNDKYVGPRSNAISFDAPQTEPNMPFLFEHFQLGANSVLLQWNKPTQPNGVLLGYNIYCSEMEGDTINEKSTIRYFVSGADNFQAKLTGLKEGTKYFVQIGAVNCAGESERKSIEIDLEVHIPQEPAMPSFRYKIDYNITDLKQQMKHLCQKTKQNPYYVVNVTNAANELDKKYTIHNHTDWIHINTNCLVNTLIKWVPDIDNNPGDYFYVKYKIKGEPEYLKAGPELEEDYLILENFNACVNYEIILVAVDGKYETESEMQETPAVVYKF